MIPAGQRSFEHQNRSVLRGRFLRLVVLVTFYSLVITDEAPIKAPKLGLAAVDAAAHVTNTHQPLIPGALAPFR